MKTYIPPKYKEFWRKHILASVYGNYHSTILVNLLFPDLEKSKSPEELKYRLYGTK